MAGKARQASVWLDYGKAGRKPKFPPNLSAAAFANGFLWTASDEMRTVECLAPFRSGFRLHRQLSLDALFPGLPGADSAREADIEALDVADGRLWICGSHSLTRRSSTAAIKVAVDPEIHKRTSRRLLGAVALTDDGGNVMAPGKALPFKGVGSLRAALAKVPHIVPFMDLPSKENGIDIEGLAVVRKKILVGLRGPVVENIALIAAIALDANFRIAQGAPFLHFVDLGGLGVRDLVRWNAEVLIVAGPVSSADGPFKLFRWTPRRTNKIQKAQEVQDFASGPDHPEGICAFSRASTPGLLVLYDTSNPKRASGTRYRADWIKLAI